MPPRDVFISYTRENESVAKSVCDALEIGGSSCWIAPRNVPVGVEFYEAVSAAIAESRVLVVILSSHADESPHVRREGLQAVDSSKPIVPLRIEDVQPSKGLKFMIAAHHWLDALSAPIETYLPQLTHAVRELLAAGLSSVPVPACKRRRRRWRS